MARKKNQKIIEQIAQLRATRKERRRTRRLKFRKSIAKIGADIKGFFQQQFKAAEVRVIAEKLILQQFEISADLPGIIKRQRVVTGIVKALDDMATFPLLDGWGILLEVGSDILIAAFRRKIEDIVDDVYDTLFEAGELDTNECATTT